VKGAPGAIDWVHRNVKKPYQLSQCLYGLHLVDEETPIAVVESEKTAIIASLAVPSYIWVATGGKENIRLIAELMGYDVTLFPDLGGYDKWYRYAMNNGYKISSLLETVATDEERSEGLDIADFIIKQIEHER
jgi:hypothetical protein